MDIFSNMFSGLASNHQLQVMVFGLIVKGVVDACKKQAAVIDKDGTKTYKIPVELMLPVFSSLAGLCSLYLNSQMSTFDYTSIVNFIMVTVPIQLSAMGIHVFWSNIKEKTAKG